MNRILRNRSVRWVWAAVLSVVVVVVILWLLANPPSDGWTREFDLRLIAAAAAAAILNVAYFGVCYLRTRKQLHVATAQLENAKQKAIEDGQAAEKISEDYEKLVGSISEENGKLTADLAEVKHTAAELAESLSRLSKQKLYTPKQLRELFGCGGGNS